jgi:hypothetical protein
VKCPYCDKHAKLVGGDVVYPHRPDLKRKRFYSCVPCNAYVGCHPNSTRPLGTIANRELRQLRGRTHSAFDPMWKRGKMSRSEAYRWLSKTLGLSTKKCHIGMFDCETCRNAIAAAQAAEGSETDGTTI